MKTLETTVAAGVAAAVATEITVTAEQLPVEAKKHAIEAIEKAYDLQWGKDGIDDTKKRLTDLNDRLSERVYLVCKDAVEIAGNKLKFARAIFLALCAVAETHIRSKDVEKNARELPMGQLIPSWTTYKSDIAKGLEKEIDPNERAEVGNALKFATANQYREAVRKASGGTTGSQAGNGRANNKNSPVLELVSRGWQESLSAAMQVLCEELGRLDHEQQKAMAPIVLDAAAQIHTKVNEMKAAATEHLAENAEDMERLKAIQTAAQGKAGRKAGRRKA